MKITNDDFTSHVCDDPNKYGDGLGWSLETDMTTEGKDELIHNQKLRELIEKEIKSGQDGRLQSSLLFLQKLLEESKK